LIQEERGPGGERCRREKVKAKKEREEDLLSEA